MCRYQAVIIGYYLLLQQEAPPTTSAKNIRVNCESNLEKYYGLEQTQREEGVGLD